MPFTIGGDWVPSEKKSKNSSKPVKVRVEKRKQTYVTLILNLAFDKEKLKEIASSLKTKLGCGGSVKNNVIEIQGEKVKDVRKILKELGIKSQ